MAYLLSFLAMFKLNFLLSIPDLQLDDVSRSVYMVDSEFPAMEVASFIKAPMSSAVVAFVGWRVCDFFLES